MAITQAVAPEDDASTVLPLVLDGDILGRVTLPSDLDGTVLVNDGFLAAQNGCLICARLDFDTGLHVNRQLCALNRECKHPLRIHHSFQ